MKYIRSIVIIVIVCFYYIIEISAISIASENKISYDIQPVIDEVEGIINEKYIKDNIDLNKLENGAVDGMLRSLDPYSGFFDEDEFKDFKNSTNGKLFGIGVEMVRDTSSNFLIITNVFANSPASESGVISGDAITHINDVSVIEIKPREVVKMIAGEKGTSVKITFYRQATGETFSKIIRSRTVKIPNVIGKVYKENIGIVEIKLFNQQTYNDFVDNINEIRTKYNIKGLIIDLRNNPGGLLESAVDIANLFLSNGQLITSVKGRKGEKIFDYVARNSESVFKDVKVVILVNRGSASASEILAGCLQDYNLAVLVGETTFGKALVQEIFTLQTTKGAIKLTTGQYHTPNDKQINGVGIEPDIKVKENRTKNFDAILQAGLTYLKTYLHN